MINTTSDDHTDSSYEYNMDHVGDEAVEEGRIKDLLNKSSFIKKKGNYT